MGACNCITIADHLDNHFPQEMTPYHTFGDIKVYFDGTNKYSQNYQVLTFSKRELLLKLVRDTAPTWTWSGTLSEAAGHSR